MNNGIIPPTPNIHEGFEQRQVLMDKMMAMCKSMDADPSTAVSAALYLAAVASIQGLKCSKDKFVEMAQVVFDDVDNQTSNNLVS